MTHQALSLLSFLYSMGKVVGRAYVILHYKLDEYQFVLYVVLQE